MGKSSFGWGRTGKGKGDISKRRGKSRALGQSVESQFTKINFMSDQFFDSLRGLFISFSLVPASTFPSPSPNL